MTVLRRMRAKIAAVMAGVMIGFFFSVGVHGIALARSAPEKKASTVTDTKDAVIIKSGTSTRVWAGLRQPRLQFLQFMLADKLDEEYDELTLFYCHQMLNRTPVWMTSLMESGWDGTLAGFNKIVQDFGVRDKKEEHDVHPWLYSQVLRHLGDGAELEIGEEERKRYGLVLKLLELAEKEVGSHKPEDWDDLVNLDPAKWSNIPYVGGGFWARIAGTEHQPTLDTNVDLTRKQRQEDKDRLKTHVFHGWQKQIKQLL